MIHNVAIETVYNPAAFLWQVTLVKNHTSAKSSLSGMTQSWFETQQWTFKCPTKSVCYPMPISKNACLMRHQPNWMWPRVIMQTQTPPSARHTCVSMIVDKIASYLVRAFTDSKNSSYMKLYKYINIRSCFLSSQTNGPLAQYYHNTDYQHRYIFLCPIWRGP